MFSAQQDINESSRNLVLVFISAMTATLMVEQGYFMLLTANQFGAGRKNIRSASHEIRPSSDAAVRVREMRHKLLVSFSGGRTSAFMAKRLKNFYAHVFEMIFVFANTGQEHEKTLIFADRCDREWGLGLVWLEAVVHHGEKIGCTHKIVTFETASRHGEPFEEVIKKYGIPNTAYPHCTRELKLNPIRSYMESIGWSDASKAVGIRVDEPRRVRKDASEVGIAYPLVNLFPTTKPQILDWFKEQPFDLGLLDHEGNCTWCWKKSMRKHVRLVHESPEIFEFPARMEATYGLAGYNEDGTKRTFFREHRSTENIISIAELLNPGRLEFQDEDAGCSESCEVFA